MSARVHHQVGRNRLTARNAHTSDDRADAVAAHQASHRYTAAHSHTLLATAGVGKQPLQDRPPAAQTLEFHILREPGVSRNRLREVQVPGAHLICGLHNVGKVVQ